MRRSLFPAALLLGALGCDSPPGAPEPLWPANYRETFTKARACRTSSEHDFHTIEVWASPGAPQAYLDAAPPGAGFAFAEGTILVKPEYADPACTDLVRVSTMKRLATGSDPDRGDWAWQRTDPDGTPIEVGDEVKCWSCHLSNLDCIWDKACTQK